MCGITGYVSQDKLSPEIISKMVEVIKHRGPDSDGVYVHNDSEFEVALGHTRLAIIDLTADGHQPMHYKDFSIVFNGEIYNYSEIKNDLLQLGHAFKSNSDTEVILHAFEEWGLKCVERFIGMFAFVIYHKIENKLYSCIDRAGVKPFYYYHNQKDFVFASELKSIVEFPKFEKKIDLDSVNQYFKYGYVPSPKAIFQKTHKLEGGSWLLYDIEKGTIELKKYWDIQTVFAQPISKITYPDAKQELKELLKSAFNYRMVSDVPVGVFLSGGFDSNLVTSILQSESTTPLKTFTIGFHHGNNEAPFAKEIAKYLGTEHHELYCSENEALAIVQDLSEYYDEPFSDSSAIPTILVSQLAKKHVTVALSADAGDEIFVGYNRYRSLAKHLDTISKIPKSSRKTFSSIINLANLFVPEHKHFTKHQLESFSNVLRQDSKYDAITLIDNIESASGTFLKHILKNYTPSSFVDYSAYNDITLNFNRAMAFDFSMYLQNDILTKVDRASMSVALESREPLLDHRIIEFAATLPLEFKFDGITTKKILKDIVFDYIPKELLDRPKTGFSIPVKHWLKNDLKEVLEDTFDWKRMEAQGILNVDYLKNIYNDFVNNKYDKAELIWRVFQFQMWYNRWI